MELIPKQTNSCLPFKLQSKHKMMETCSATADVTSKLSSDSELSESIKCESLTSEVESEENSGSRKKLRHTKPEGPCIDEPLVDKN